MPKPNSNNPKKLCSDCPLGCHRPKPMKKKNKLEAYAALWGLDIEAGFGGFVASYHHLCDDIGVEAFETAQAVALAMEAGIVPRSAPAILQAVEEISIGSELGRIIGHGPEYAAERWGVKLTGKAGPSKDSGHSEMDEIFLDSTGLCAFAYSIIKTGSEFWTNLGDLLKAKYGPDFDVEKLRRMVQEAGRLN